ncbi:DUF4293 domain-containing protein [Pinibacter aurantiacus]|uniref:DUF4293 domain-containing protein n=1 Tax=Pinibacter aurantiacus TaxID=2851599 RepID=A0A9E2S5J7_9BACT|nr:DUF4293 domain-containing protein [Pinibacter aurantiacus]MBV4356037.1 DUF4293 domain-containing protein [Pinibacter aurantiacus]
MIQRIQTIWLALAAICGFAMSRVPLFNATLADNSSRIVFASDHLVVFALSIAVACMSTVAIFLFKKRTTQFKLAVTGILLSIAVVGLEVYYINAFKQSTPMVKGTYSWGGLLPIAMAIFLWLAAGGIRRDEKLVKSLDRLR